MPIANDWDARKVLRFVFDARDVALDEGAARTLVLPLQELKRLAETLIRQGLIREVEPIDHVAITERGEAVVRMYLTLARR